MKCVEYHPDARLDLIESAKFYEGRQAGLGDRFLDAVMCAEAIIKRHPEAGTPDACGTRRMRVPRFPYGVVYKAYQNSIVVFAIVNFNRRPDFWHERL